MKKYAAIFMLGLCAFCFSFTKKPGGDSFEIYLNGKQVIQQFVLAKKATATLNLSSSNGNDKIDVFYSHCGRVGTSRVLTIRNEKGEPLKEWKFANENNKRSFMSFTRKEIPETKTDGLRLYYSSKELPEGRLLATIRSGENKTLAKL